MNKWIKRVLSAVLVCVLVGGAIPFSAMPVMAASVGTISFDQASYSCNVGEQITLALTVISGNDEINVGLNAVSFTCSDPSAINIASYGHLWDTTTPGKWIVQSTATANKTGAYTITATISNGQKATATIYSSVYPLTVVGGSGSGNYVAGANVNITANSVPNGEGFYKWISSDATIQNATSATTTIRMPANAATVTAVYAKTPSSKSIQKTAKEWLAAYDKYISAIKKEVKKEAKQLNDEDPQDVFEEAAKNIQVTGEWDYISNANEKALAQNSARQGILGMLIESDYYKKNLDLADINDKDINVFALKVVKNITKSIWTLNVPRKQYGKYYVKISITGVSQTLTGTMTLTDSTNSSNHYVGSLSANASRTAAVLADYIEQMTKLSVSAYKIALEEAIKELTGYTFEELLSNKANDFLKEHGFGAVNEVLGKCNELYNIAVKCKSMPINGNAQDWYDWATSVKNKAESYFVNQGSFSNSVVNGAYEKMDKARERLFDSVAPLSPAPACSTYPGDARRS